MRFPPSFLDEIRARVPVSSVIGRSVQWDRRKTNAGRGDYWACCPFHTEKTPSFHCEDRKGRYHCFGCKQSGDIFTFLVEKEGLNFPEAVERLAGEAGLKMPEVSPEAEAREERRANLYDVMEMAVGWFENRLQAADGAAARGYLSDRGLSAKVQQDFRIGYAPEGRYGLKEFLGARKVAPEQMVDAGLLIAGDDIPVAYDRFRERIMFPIRDERGRVIAFGGRAMRADQPAKYLNSPEGPLFHKRSVLYNFDKARKPAYEAGQIIAVEGYMDVIAMARAGIAHAVAPLGTALTAEQLGLMWRTAPEPVLCFDGDSAGLMAAYRALDTALELLQPGKSLRFVLLPEGQDPDDLLKSDGPAGLKQAVAQALPMSELLWRRALDGNDRSTPERRARFEAELDDTVNRIADGKVRAHYQAELRERTRALWRGAQPAKPGTAARTGGRFDQTARYRTVVKPMVAARRTSRMRPEAHDYRLPASPELARSPLARFAQRQRAATDIGECQIVQAVINHPALLDDQAEVFSELEFHSPMLDTLRREILDVAALTQGLDRALLRDQLEARGRADDVRYVSGRANRLRLWFLAAEAALQDVAVGFRQLVGRHRKTAILERELTAAEAALAETPSEENLQHLNEIREQLLSTVDEEASIEGFGAASGRPADQVV